MAELAGWLLDLYPDPQQGIVLWLLGEDGARHRLRQDFPVTFYAAGPSRRLRQLWRFLEQQPLEMALSRQERRDLFEDEPVTLLAARLAHAVAQPTLFRK
jgi:hypothetical protein